MGFLLTIAEGKEAGREFVFEQSSVTIGRTSECDIVLYDPGVSRRHARIFAEGEGFFVEDMGSSNGTKVNGVVVKKQQLSSGDAVALGPVVFHFQPTELEDDPTTAGQPPDESTRIVQHPRPPAGRVRGKGEALAPEGAAPEELEQLSRTRTAGSQNLARVKASPARRGAPGARGAEPDDEALDDDGIDDAPTGPRRALALASDQPGPRPLSAAERARIRRENAGPIASFKLFWLEASIATQRVVLGVGACVVLGLLALLYWAVLAPSRTVSNLPPEPSVLSREPISYSFGLGEGVDYRRADMKIFEFEFTAPVRAVVLLHFQAKDIAQGEVSVSANGADVGLVPPDTLNASEIAHEVIIPPHVLKKGEKNQVIFDNVKNPPGAESWRVWNTWVEIALLPEIPLDQLRRDAEDAFGRGQQSFERRDVGAENRYQAWREFRSAWLMLEGHPEPKPELYLLARDQMRRAQQELDRTCAKLILEVQRYYNQKDWNAARSTLEHMRDYFPNKDQPCYFKPDEIRDQYQL